MYRPNFQSFVSFAAVIVCKASIAAPVATTVNHVEVSQPKATVVKQLPKVALSPNSTTANSLAVKSSLTQVIRSTTLKSISANSEVGPGNSSGKSVLNQKYSSLSGKTITSSAPAQISTKSTAATESSQSLDSPTSDAYRTASPTSD